jgi:hypothetical protein
MRGFPESVPLYLSLRTGIGACNHQTLRCIESGQTWVALRTHSPLTNRSVVVSVSMWLFAPVGGFVFVVAALASVDRIRNNQSWILPGLVSGLGFSGMMLGWLLTVHEHLIRIWR